MMMMKKMIIALLAVVATVAVQAQTNTAIANNVVINDINTWDSGT